MLYQQITKIPDKPPPAAYYVYPYILIPDESLRYVREAGDCAQGKTASVELVYQWIQALIVQGNISAGGGLSGVVMCF